MSLLLDFSYSVCSKSSTNSEATETPSSDSTTEIKLSKAPPSPEYADAKLIAEAIDIFNEDSTLSANMAFVVEDYELGVQTEDAPTRGIANSGKGQHIHLIVNNGPLFCTLRT